MDVIIWNSVSMAGNSAESRFFWIEQHILSDPQITSENPYNHIPFATPKKYDCSEKGFTQAYSENTPFLKDGLLFIHKEAPYIPLLNPYMYLWKDQFISLYVIEDTNSKDFSGFVNFLDNNNVESISCVLELNKQNELRTLEGTTITNISTEEKEAKGYFTGNLITVDIGKIVIDPMATDISQAFDFQNIQIVGLASRHRAIADTFSKIIFQFLAKNAPISADDILKAIRNAHTEADIES